MKPHAQSSSTLIVENRGDSLLVMDEPTASCGCQKPELGRRELEPGQRTTLILRQTARPEDGVFQYVVRLKSNDAANPIKVVVLNGVVSRGIVVRPDPLDFGFVKPGASAKRYIEVASDDGTQFQLSHVGADGPLTVKSLASSRAEFHRVEVTLRAPETYGVFRGSVVVNTDKPDADPIWIDVHGSVLGQLSVSPAAIALGTVYGNTSVKRVVVITKQSNDLKLKSVSLPVGLISVTHRLTSVASNGKMDVVEISLDLPNRTGEINCTLAIDYAGIDGKVNTIRVPIVGFSQGR